ncbi:hypothetical protein MRX96_042891 [Rhipicephalus microplus]
MILISDYAQDVFEEAPGEFKRQSYIEMSSCRLSPMPPPICPQDYVQDLFEEAPGEFKRQSNSEISSCQLSAMPPPICPHDYVQDFFEEAPDYVQDFFEKAPGTPVYQKVKVVVLRACLLKRKRHL